MKNKIQNVENNINEACLKSGRERSDVTLIAVSKTKPLPDLQEAYALGMRHFGENKVQELMDKIPAMPSDCKWHMIGHLQRNKVKYLIGKVKYIHSVDSVRLAEEISKESVKAGVITHILAEINVAGEDSKFGTSDEAENLSLLEQISSMPGISLDGLMTIAPFTEDAESNRKYFHYLKEFSLGAARKYFKEEPILSMGMTGDYQVAIEEGAHFVRVGTGIFGNRQYMV